MFKTYSMELAGRLLTIETGKLAGLTNANVLVRYGDTVVMVNVVASKEPRDGVDFFPLSVDYEEKMYAAGKIPGGFTRREGKAADKAILVSRAIDRPIRPLFPKDFRNDVVVTATVLSVEIDNSPEVCAMIGTSAALSISDIPFGGPTAAVKVGYVDGEFVIKPTLEQRKKSELDLLVAGTMDKIAMIEAGAKELPDDKMLEAIKAGHVEIKKVCEFISKIKEERAEEIKTDIADSLYKLEKKSVRAMILNEHKRPDGRQIDEIRPLSCEVGILPRVHGSAVFTRGQTQVMSIATLGMTTDEQLLDGLDEETSKRYIHQYNFPGYSVGEAKPVRGPGRREIGHGALAERALVPVIPSEEEFPYTIRVVSEVLSSNGSTSQASICGSTLALMDAGVPIKEPVAGISTGLVTDSENPDNYVMLTDIQGLEDFFGDMDFKVGGTKNGITAIQVDIKVDGLSYKIIEEAFARTRKARQYILDEVMLKQIAKPREEVSKYAPKILTMKIKPEKIKDVIGTGGKTINKIIEETGVKIDISEEGNVVVYSVDKEAAQKAIDKIENIVREIEVGEYYDGVVTKLMPFGAFVDVGGGKEGLLHISKISKERVEKIEDVLSVGDRVIVKVLDIDKQGKISLKKIGEQTEN